MAKKAKKTTAKKAVRKAAGKPAKKKSVKKAAARKPAPASVKKTSKKAVKKTTARKPAAAIVKKSPAPKPAAKTAPKPVVRPAAETPKTAPALSAVYPDQIPDRNVRLTDGSTAPLSSLAGPKGLVLYFYPKDDTPGCTVEACNFRDADANVKAAGYNIVGVSPDTSASHQKFTAKYHLTFPLIADEDHSLCDAAGVWQEKSMYGKTYMGVARTTFVLDRALNVKKVYEKVKPDGHADAVAGDIAAL